MRWKWSSLGQNAKLCSYVTKITLYMLTDLTTDKSVLQFLCLSSYLDQYFYSFHYGLSSADLMAPMGTLGSLWKVYAVTVQLLIALLCSFIVHMVCGEISSWLQLCCTQLLCVFPSDVTHNASLCTCDMSGKLKTHCDVHAVLMSKLLLGAFLPIPLLSNQLTPCAS